MEEEAEVVVELALSTLLEEYQLQLAQALQELSLQLAQGEQETILQMVDLEVVVAPGELMVVLVELPQMVLEGQEE
jgi:hypothetical protein